MLKEKLNAVVQQEYDTKNILALNVMIRKDHRIAYARKMGHLSKGGKPISAHSLFTIGSISKIFTAVSILRLVDQGKVKLDSPITDYLPIVMADERYKKITVRMLISHCAGFSGNASKGKYTLFQNEPYLDDVLDFMKQSRLYQEPGTFSVYCNDGFAMAEKLVEEVTGETFSDFVRDEICAPLGMKDTDFPDHEIEAEKIVHADSYLDLSYPQEFVNSIGSGGIYSTAGDLCTFMDALADQKLLSPELHAEMNALQAPCKYEAEKQYGQKYGLGWDTVELDTLSMFGLKGYAKGGSTYGFTSYAFTVPQLHMSAAIVMSSTNGDAPTLLKNLFTIVLEEMGLKRTDDVLPELTSLQTPQILGCYGNNSALMKLQEKNGQLCLEDHVLTWNGHGYAVNGPLFGRENPVVYFVPSEERIYLLVEFASGVPHHRQRRLYMQKLNMEPSATFGGVGKTYLLINERYDQRQIGYKPMLWKPVQVENQLLCPYPLHVLNETTAKAELEIPDNFSREMYDCTMVNNELHLGQYRYVPMESCVKPLRSAKFTITNGETHYFYGNDGLDSLSMKGYGRLFMLEENGHVVYDSEYSEALPETLEGLILGFTGRDETEIEINVTE